MELKVFGGRASLELTRKICEGLGLEIGRTKVTDFLDTEKEVRFEESVRGTDLFIVQSTHPPAENWMELFLWLDAAKRAAAGSITAVVPYFGYARQDRKPRPRVPISAKLMAVLMEASTGRAPFKVLTIDLHAGQIQGFFEVPHDHLYARPVFVDYFKKHFPLDNFVVAGPDEGAGKLARAYAERLDGRPVVFIYKMRFAPDKVRVAHVVGDVAGRDVLLVDDMVSTGGTIIEAAQELTSKGARSVYAFCTHAVLAGTAIADIEASYLSKLYVTDTIPLKRESPKIEVISVAPLLAEVIKRSHNNESVSSLFE